MQMTIEQAEALVKEAEQNDGRCGTCGQSIKIYRYRLNRNLAVFLRAMAQKIKETGKNDVDISEIGLAYSVRSQISKLRLHGLVARVKDDRGIQIARHWLITHKGWKFLNNEPIPERVSEFNNQVMGHDGRMLTMSQVLGEPYDPTLPKYEEAPVTPNEAKVYHDIRKPQVKTIQVEAVYRGSRYNKKLDVGSTYKLVLERLRVGSPVIITMPYPMTYKDIAALQKEWKIL